MAIKQVNAMQYLIQRVEIPELGNSRIKNQKEGTV
jgi:hypothetical protein